MAEPAAAVAPAPAQGPQREEETTFQRVMGIVQVRLPCDNLVN
jgi:hypothetical protein